MNIPHEILARIPGCEGARPPHDVVQLPGGEGRNEVLRVHTDAGFFVWRHRLSPVDRPGSRALTELGAHRLAAAARIAPALFDHAPDGSWMLMEHVDAAPWRESDLLSEDGIDRLGARLAQLHGIVAHDLPVADAPAMARGYLALAGRRDPRIGARLHPLVERVEQLTAQLAGMDESRVLVHGDLMGSNLLGPLPMLVDWEYAQSADPTWDLACLLSYYPQLEHRLDRLLAVAGNRHTDARARLVVQRERFALLHGLWEQAYIS